MASPLQQTVGVIKDNDYTFLVIITAVGYDYILTLSKEIEYIWNKPWTLVSTLFVLVRYFGLCFIISTNIFYTSFLPGFVKVCETSIALSIWSALIFWLGADLVMILRVWALHNLSKLVLHTLLMVYAMWIISALVYYTILQIQWGSNNGMGYGIVHAFQLSVCVYTESLALIWLRYLATALGMALGVLMSLLTAIQFIKAVWNMTNCHGLKLNHYIKSLARDAMIYFIVTLISALISMLNNSNLLFNSWAGWLATCLLQNVPPIILVPRFILSLRGLYSRNLQDRTGCRIDSAFGFGSRLGQDTVWSVMEFVDHVEHEGNERDDEQGDERSDGTQMVVVEEVRV